MKQQKLKQNYESFSVADDNDLYIHRIPDGPPSPPPRRFSSKDPIEKVDGPTSYKNMFLYNWLLFRQARRNQVIRPQIRGRIPAEPADFAKQLPQLTQTPRTLFIAQPPGGHIQYPPAPQPKQPPRMVSQSKYWTEIGSRVL